MRTAAISVIIPCFNCEHTIKQTLDSVINQTLISAEIILIDDFSTDNSVVTINNYIAEHPNYNIKLICLRKNVGPGMARNTGWEKASQKWLAFLDADDVWHPKKVELQYDYLEANPNIHGCGHLSELYNNEQDMETVNFETKIVSYQQMLFSNRLPTRSVMLKRSLSHRFKDKSFTEDYLMWLEILADKFIITKLDIVLAFSLRPEFSVGGYSGQLWIHEKRELNSFKFLFKKQKLTLLGYWFFCLFSLLKFIKRAGVNFFRKL